MSKSRFMKISLLVVAGFILSGTVSANLITNGSFEDGSFTPVSDGSWVRVNNGETKITGWTVGGVAVDWHNTTEFQPILFGHRAVDLNLNGGSGQTGILSQTFVTEIGTWYELEFWLAGPNTGFPVPRQTLVDVAGLHDVIFTQNASPVNFLVWGHKSLQFQAIAGSTTLSFASANDTGDWGAVVDNVSVERVPEPATLALVALGLAGLGFSRREKQKSA